MLRQNIHGGEKIKQMASEVPHLLLDTTIHPITRTIMRINLTITPDFKWNNYVSVGVVVAVPAY